MKRFLLILGVCGLTTAATVLAQSVPTPTVFSKLRLIAGSYLNWGTTEGVGGCGFRDNAGVIETKNCTLGSSWGSIGGAATGASTALNNLLSVAVNVELTPGTDNSIALGSTLKRWTGAYILQLPLLTSNGFVKVGSGNGTLSVDTGSYVLTSTTVNGHALSANVTVTKGDIGLGNVENTALSTWVGSTAITTLGTIATGTVPWANVSKTGSSYADLQTRQVPEGDFAFTDVSTANASAAKHGLMWKLSGDVTTCASGVGSWVACGGGGGTSPPFSDAGALVKNSVDATKLLTVNVSAITTGTTRQAYAPDSDTYWPIMSQRLTFSGPTVARTYTLPDAAATLAALGQNQTWIGVQTFAASGVKLSGAGAGLATFTYANTASDRTITFPDPGGADSVVYLAAAQSLTNKKLGSLVSNGFVKTGSGDGTLSVDTTAYTPTSTTVAGHALSSNVSIASTELTDTALLARYADASPHFSGTTGPFQVDSYVALKKGPRFDVLAFGAVAGGTCTVGTGTNGATNDTAFANARAAAVTAGGGVIFVPPGTWCLNSQLNLTTGLSTNGLVLEGAGPRDSTLIFRTAGAAAIVFASSSTQFMIVRHLSVLHANGALPGAQTAGQYGLYANKIGNQALLEDLDIKYFANDAIYIQGGTGPTKIADVQIQANAGYGVNLAAVAGPPAEAPANVSIVRGNIQVQWGGIRGDGSNILTVSDVDIELGTSAQLPCVYLGGGTIIGVQTPHLRNVTCSVGSLTTITPAGLVSLTDTDGAVIEGGYSYAPNGTSNIRLTSTNVDHGHHTVILGGSYQNSAAGPGYFVTIGGGTPKFLTVLSPYLQPGVWAAGHDIVNDVSGNKVVAVGVGTTTSSTTATVFQTPGLYTDGATWFLSNGGGTILDLLQTSAGDALLTLRRTGAAPQQWDVYIPLGSNDFRIKQGGADRFILTNAGAVTATSFSGSGSGLTALTAANISAGTAGISITGNAATVTNGAYTNVTNTFSSLQKFGTNPSATGIIGLGNNQAINSRNAANTMDWNLIYLNASDQVILGTSGGGVVKSWGGLYPAGATGTGEIGNEATKWGLVRATIITPGDLKFENDWSITEADRLGLPDGLAFRNRHGEVIDTLTDQGFTKIDAEFARLYREIESLKTEIRRLKGSA